MFNENSGVVRTWVRLILSGAKTINDIPNLSNLREVVISVVNNNG